MITGSIDRLKTCCLFILEKLFQIGQGNNLAKEVENWPKEPGAGQS